MLPDASPSAQAAE